VFGFGFGFSACDWGKFLLEWCFFLYSVLARQWQSDEREGVAEIREVR
jgi:hypothetical protein